MSGMKASVFDEEEVQITYTRRRDGKPKSIPVWFTIKEGKMELLPMYGVKTKWFSAVEASGRIGLAIKQWKKDGEPVVVREPGKVDEIKGRFGTKYGRSNVKRYYSTSEVALVVPV